MLCERTVVEFPLCSLSDVNNVAKRLSSALAVESFVIYLIGELGAGKTTVARAMLRGIGYENTVRSPSYSLVESYFVKGQKIHHFDFFRCDNSGEWLSAGLDELFDDASAICLIEWPERASTLPSPDISLEIIVEPNDRRTLSLRPDSDKGDRVCFALSG